MPEFGGPRSAFASGCSQVELATIVICHEAART